MSKKKSLPPAVWVALGLTACKDVVGPCLDIAPIDTGPCLDIPQDTALDTDIGPCLDVPPDSGIDTGVGPCLDIAPETGLSDTGDTAATAETGDTSDTGDVTTQHAKSPAGTGLREQLLQQLVDQGIFTPDTAARLLGGPEGPTGGADGE